MCYCHNLVLLWSECLCSPPKCMYQKPTPKVIILGGDPLGRHLGHEGKTLINGIMTLKRRLREFPSTVHHVNTQREVGHLRPGRGTSPECDSRPLNLGLPRLRNCEKYIMVVYKLANLWHFVIVARSGQDRSQNVVWAMCYSQKMKAVETLYGRKENS